MSSHSRARVLNDSSDRITQLPELVISHILSLLPTKEAVATSLLSRRWKCLWRNIHNLSFQSLDSRHHLNGDREVKFTEFVNKVLTFLNGQPIDKFSLETDENYNELYDVTTWITTALARKLKVLKLHLVSFDFDLSCCKLSSKLFTCETLEDLDLYGLETLDVPSLVCLPKLKSLSLQWVTYKCDECVRKLISGCSSLETLIIDREPYDNVVTFTISSLTLRNLTFTFYLTGQYSPTEPDKQLEINAPSLRYLHLKDECTMNFSVENLCSLDEAEVETNFIDFIDYPDNYELIRYEQYAKAVVKLLQGVYNVKHLSLRGDILEALSNVGAFPGFPRLTQLDVTTKYCRGNALLHLVAGSNKLEFLTLKRYFLYKDTHVTCWREPKKLPTCLLSCLHKLSIIRFQGLEDELAMVAYILKNAKVLRTMTIEAACLCNLEARFQLLQKVSKFTRVSEECEISFWLNERVPLFSLAKWKMG